MASGTANRRPPRPARGDPASLQRRRLVGALLAAPALGAHGFAIAGAQLHEPLTESAKATMQALISRHRHSVPDPHFDDVRDKIDWLDEMAHRLAKRMPDFTARIDFLKTVHHAATLAGLDVQLVLGLIQVESAFRKYAVSTAGAQGYMQVMPFWTRELGNHNDNLFDMATNLHYGCAILRHYLNIESGNLFRALGRYNGSLGKAPYPNSVLAAWQTHWNYAKGGAGRVAERARAPVQVTRH